jgi:hypothetical protein
MRAILSVILCLVTTAAGAVSVNDIDAAVQAQAQAGLATANATAQFVSTAGGLTETDLLAGACTDDAVASLQNNTVFSDGEVAGLSDVVAGVQDMSRSLTGALSPVLAASGACGVLATLNDLQACGVMGGVSAPTSLTIGDIVGFSGGDFSALSGLGLPDLGMLGGTALGCLGLGDLDLGALSPGSTLDTTDLADWQPGNCGAATPVQAPFEGTRYTLSGTPPPPCKVHSCPQGCTYDCDTEVCVSVAN